MTDCGTPAYALPMNSAVTCETCTACCNSDEICQKNRIWALDIVLVGAIVLFAAPFGFGLGFFIMFVLCRRYGMNDPRDPLEIYDPDSSYCLIFSDDKIAWIVYVITYFIQVSFFYLFLSASSFTHVSSDWQFTLVCAGSNTECIDLNTVTSYGWFLFYVLTFSTLGPDLANSIYQIRKAIFIRDGRLFLSGFLFFGLTTIAVFASVFYNQALATTDTELIVNAVILLFINDLDEQFMNILHTTNPFWIYERLEEIEEAMKDKIDPLGSKHITKHRIEASQQSPEVSDSVTQLETSKSVIGLGEDYGVAEEGENAVESENSA